MRRVLIAVIALGYAAVALPVASVAGFGTFVAVTSGKSNPPGCHEKHRAARC